VAAASLSGAFSLPATAAEPVTVTWSTLGGFYTDLMKDLASKFEKQSGIRVKIIEIDLAQLYEKQIIEAVGGTGAYDVITYASQWKPEYVNAGWLLPIDDELKAAKYDLNDIAPALVDTSNRWQGKTYGLPYYTYTMGQFFRLDLLEDPTERAAFKAKYGRDLGAPKTYQEMAEVAEFFRRKPGQTLKGQPLTKDFYGIGLMAGRFNHLVDEIAFSLAPAMGGSIVRDDGKPGVANPEFVAAVKFYVEKLLPYAPPGATTSGYDEVIAQLRQGLIAQTGPMYLDQWPNAAKTEKETPGAEVGAGTLPYSATLVGAFNIGVAKGSRHKKEALRWVQYVGSAEAQRQFASGGGATARISILKDKEFQRGHRETMGQYPVLLQALEHTEKARFYPNIYYVAQSGKINESMISALSAAVSKQKTVDAAMADLAKEIERHCAGPCKVQNAHLGKGFSPKAQPYTFDPSTWVRK
jgi:multiple sugar transport system substrate-binding protein